MNDLQRAEELESLARQLNIQIRYEKGDFDGGFCVLKDKKIVVVNKRLPDPRKASALAQALGEYGLETIYVKPALRAYIEDEIAKASKGR